MKILAFWVVGYIGSILAANWFIHHVGTSCIPDGPCLIPVGLGYVAPSGVLWIGMALFLRDQIHENGGRWWVLGGIVAGAGLSALISPALAVASGTAFLLGEFADFAIYSPLRQRFRPAAVLASGTVGAVVDSAVFLWLAFGSLAFIEGQIIGKVEMTVLAAVLIWGHRAISKRGVHQRIAS